MATIDKVTPDGFITAVKKHLLWWQERGLSFTASGYGSNIPTSLVAYCADGKRRRIRTMVYSNVGVNYIVIGGERHIVRDHQLPDITP